MITSWENVKAFEEADRAWSEAVERLYPDGYPEARYDARGTSTPELRQLAEARARAHGQAFGE